MPEAVYKIKVPSVSTIINEMIPDPEFDQFVASVGKEQADKIMISAGNRGSALHMFIETFVRTYHINKDISEALKVTQEESPEILRKELIPEDKIEEGRNLFYKFYYSDYCNIFYNILALELPIYSPSLFYRGKLDIFYKDKLFGFSVTDFKSSNGKIKKGSTKEFKYKHQLGGYIQALEEMYTEKKLIINRATILCVDKQSEILQEIELIGKEMQEYKNGFIELVKQYHIKQKQEYLFK
jgi:hypothetical protein